MIQLLDTLLYIYSTRAVELFFCVCLVSPQDQTFNRHIKEPIILDGVFVTIDYLVNEIDLNE